VRRAGNKIDLTSKEYGLLKYLMVIVNLVDNAIKYTLARRERQSKVEVDSREGAGSCLSRSLAFRPGGRNGSNA
jgi:signal transduction histidine kinase